MEDAAYDTLLLATREHPEQARRLLVVLKPVALGEEHHLQRRAREEVQLARYLQHPNIAAVHGYAVYGGQPYVVMEHMHGCFLLTVMDAALQSGVTLSPAFAAYVAAEVADALEYAHRCVDDMGRPLKLVHRAVGPLRIRLGVGSNVKLTNFGAAFSEMLGRLPTPTGLLRGDTNYLAPEILQNVLRPALDRPDALTPRNLDGRADIFSLGLVLLEMLAASYPLDPPEELPSHAPQLPAHVRSERPPLLKLETLADRVLHLGPEEVRSASRNVPEPLRGIVTRALRQAPAERYPTAGDMAAELRQYLGTLGQPYGRRELDEEVARILKHAARYHTLDALGSVEKGVLPLPPDMEGEE
ncbi:serine/threonine-protein kinase [Archangium sp.]|uniref:serine/threonine-protein kinase n=1 Tax=Archangium sp. TaxID=1872627 RepID=UPI002ED77C3A